MNNLGEVENRAAEGPHLEYQVHLSTLIQLYSQLAFFFFFFLQGIHQDLTWTGSFKYLFDFNWSCASQSV